MRWLGVLCLLCLLHQLPQSDAVQPQHRPHKKAATVESIIQGMLGQSPSTESTDALLNGGAEAEAQKDAQSASAEDAPRAAVSLSSDNSNAINVLKNKVVHDPRGDMTIQGFSRVVKKELEKLHEQEVQIREHASSQQQSEQNSKQRLAARSTGHKKLFNQYIRRIATDAATRAKLQQDKAAQEHLAHEQKEDDTLKTQKDQTVQQEEAKKTIQRSELSTFLQKATTRAETEMREQKAKADETIAKANTRTEQLKNQLAAHKALLQQELSALESGGASFSSSSSSSSSSSHSESSHEHSESSQHSSHSGESSLHSSSSSSSPSSSSASATSSSPSSSSASASSTPTSASASSTSAAASASGSGSSSPAASSSSSSPSGSSSTSPTSSAQSSTSSTPAKSA